jgi:hypothetical protein
MGNEFLRVIRDDQGEREERELNPITTSPNASKRRTKYSSL